MVPGWSRRVRTCIFWAEAVGPRSRPGRAHGLQCILKLLLGQAHLAESGQLPDPAAFSQVLAEVRALACGLAAQGVKRGDHIAIIGANRPRVYWSVAAAQCLGAIPVGLYQDATAPELLYMFQNAGICHAIVEAHRGRIWVEPTRPQGATFTFSLPLGTPPAVDLAEEPPTSAGSSDKR